MARTPSTMLELGTQAPAFTLPEPASGYSVSLSDYNGQPVLIAFICNHCPYVVLIKEEFAKFAEEYRAKGLNVVAISANDVESYPDDSPEKMISFGRENNFNFPYLYDETQETAKNYRAACTPDFFMFDGNHQLFYRGQFDDARPNSGITVSGKDMRQAAEALLNGKASPENQQASLGCNIKWKPGNEPSY